MDILFLIPAFVAPCLWRSIALKGWIFLPLTWFQLGELFCSTGAGSDAGSCETGPLFRQPSCMMWHRTLSCQKSDYPSKSPLLLCDQMASCEMCSFCKAAALTLLACALTRRHSNQIARLHSSGILLNLLPPPIFSICLSAELISVCFPSCMLEPQITPALKSNTCLIKRSCQTVSRVPNVITGIIAPLLSFILSSPRHLTAIKNKISNSQP